MAEPFPTPPITWQGRDAKGNVVDVTSDTTVTSQPPSVTAGGEQTIRLLGPFTLTYTAQADGQLVLLDTLDVGNAVLQAWAIVSTTFDQAPVGVQIGLADDVDYTTYVELLQVNASILNGPSVLGRDVRVGSTDHYQHSGVVQSGVQQLVAGVYDDGAPSNPTEGAIHCYALIAEPAE